MTAHVYTSTKLPIPNWKYEDINNIYELVGMINFLPDNNSVVFSVQDLKKLIGIKTETELDFSLR